MDDLRFIHLKIEPRELPEVRKHSEKYERFRFVNTKFGSHIEHCCATEDDTSPVTRFIVALTIEIPGDGTNPPPYIISAKCVGYFSIKKAAFPDFDRRYDVGVVNGASLLYGALRETIAENTARAWYGQLILPALSFQDNAPSLGGHEVVESEQIIAPEKKATARRKSSVKKIKSPSA